MITTMKNEIPSGVQRAKTAKGVIMPRLEIAKRVRAFMEQSGGEIEAAKWVLQTFAKKTPKNLSLDSQISHMYLLQMVQKWLNEGDYLNAARLLWNEKSFLVEPQSVRKIWDALPLYAEVMMQGAGSLGKTYTPATWFMLDWIRDPEWTCIKVVSLTGQHAQRNCFAQMKNLHATSIIQLPGECLGKSIQVGNDDKQGIHLLAIPKGDTGEGSLRGFHPVPRSELHPQFGMLSRVRAILDEAEKIPHGVWQGVNNMLIARAGVEHVKVCAASNPQDRNSEFGLKCEPEKGWESVQMGVDESWKGKKGAHVICLDGAKCENVVQRKVVYEGLLTWEGYQHYLRLGDTHPEYITMARGWFPESGLSMNIISHDMVERAIGNFRFYGKTVYAAAVDLAFEGGDRAVMSIGRFGRLAKEEKFGLEAVSQFELAHRKTLEMADEIMKICKNLHVTPDWLACDRTGNGTGVHDALCSKFGPEVMGIHFGSGSTDTKVLADDQQKASELYDGIVTEVWFAMRKWLEFGFLKFSPAMKMDNLRKELTARRYKTKGERVRVESKGDYKARGFNSPDEADSLSMLLHLVRLRSSDFAAYMIKAPSNEEWSPPPKHGLVDRIEFVNFGD